MATSPQEIRLNDQQQRQLAEIADQAGKPWTVVLREALLAYRPDQTVLSASGNESFFDKATRLGLIGCVEGGPPDLSTNPKYMEGFGEVARKRVVVDAGPLVAMLRPADEHHQRCVAQSQQLETPLLTSWAVLAEACWLLRERPMGVVKLLDQIEQGLVEPLELDPKSIPWMKQFLVKYNNLSAQLADASLCYLAEREGIDTVFTLDRRDFLVYRSQRNKPFQLLP